MGRLTPETSFDPSCCDGGECSINDMSAQSCGCDKGANWICERHRHEREWLDKIGEVAKGIPQEDFDFTALDKDLPCKPQNLEAAEVTAMSPVKHSITCAVVNEEDGLQCFFELTLENPIGFSSTTPDSYWTQLLNNLAENCPTILRPEEMDSSRYGLLNGLKNL